MKLLLDTHALAWWWADDPKLPNTARQVIADPANLVIVSAVSAWEIATKSRLGKWPQADSLLADFDDLLRRSRFVDLPITVTHARLAGSLDGKHRDPFDRMLIAQSRVEDATLITADPIFARYRVSVIWR